MKETTMGNWIPTEEIGDMVDFLGGFPTEFAKLVSSLAKSDLIGRERHIVSRI